MKKHHSWEGAVSWRFVQKTTYPKVLPFMATLEAHRIGQSGGTPTSAEDEQRYGKYPPSQTEQFPISSGERNLLGVR